MEKLLSIVMSFFFLILCGSEETAFMQEQGLTNNNVVLKSNTLRNIKTRIADATLKFRKKRS